MFSNKLQVFNALESLQSIISREINKDVKEFDLCFDVLSGKTTFHVDNKIITSGNVILTSLLKTQVRQFKKQMSLKEVKKLVIKKMTDTYLAELHVKHDNSRKEIINITNE